MGNCMLAYLRGILALPFTALALFSIYVSGVVGGPKYREILVRNFDRHFAQEEIRHG
jgi:hypothetical protein